MMNYSKADPKLAPQLVQNIHSMKFASPDKCAVRSTPIEAANGDNDCNPRYWSPNCSKKEEPRSMIVCTRDLIEWSYQIACGMNYLTKRKVNMTLLEHSLLTSTTSITLRSCTGIWRHEMFYWRMTTL